MLSLYNQAALLLISFHFPILKYSLRKHLYNLDCITCGPYLAFCSLSQTCWFPLLFYLFPHPLLTIEDVFLATNVIDFPSNVNIISSLLMIWMNLQIIIKMSAANGVRRVWVGQNGLLSTPAVSAVIRERVGADVSYAVCNLHALSLLIFSF